MVSGLWVLGAGRTAGSGTACKGVSELLSLEGQVRAGILPGA